MAATLTQDIVVTFAPPMVSAETRADLAQERLRLLRNPDLTLPAADLNRTERFVFRTKPGTVKSLFHNLDVPPSPEAKNGPFNRKIWERNQARNAGLKPGYTDGEKANEVKAAERKIDDLTNRIGGTLLIFTRVPRAVECYYATDDAVLASYIRDLVDRRVGEFGYVYEESGLARVIAGPGTEFEKAFPNTDLGWRTARSYAGEHGLDDIRVVRE